MWSFEERLVIGCKNIASVHATSQYKHVKIVLTEQQPAFIFDVKPRITEQAPDGNQLFIVNFENVGTVHRFADNIFGIELLPQVDVENLQAFLRSGVKKAVYCSARHLAALGQRTEANGAALLGCRLNVGRKRYVIPCHAVFNVVRRHPFVVECNLYRARRIVDNGHDIFHMVALKYVFCFVAERVIAECANRTCVVTILTYVIGKVGRGAS